MTLMAFFLPVCETHHIVEDDIDGVFPTCIWGSSHCRGWGWPWRWSSRKNPIYRRGTRSPNQTSKEENKKHLLGRLTVYKNLLTLSRFLPQISLLSCSHGLQKGFLHSQHTNTGQWGMEMLYRFKNGISQTKSLRFKSTF